MHRSCRTRDGHLLVVNQTHLGQILGVHQDHIPPLLVPVQIVVLIDHRVELTFAAHGHEPQLVLRQGRDFGQFMDHKRRSAIGGIEPRFVERPSPHLKLLLGRGDRIERFVSRYHLGDPMPNGVGLLHLLPIDGLGFSQRQFGNLRDDMHLAAGTREPFGPSIAEPHVVEHRLLGRRLGLFVSGEHR